MGSAVGSAARSRTIKLLLIAGAVGLTLSVLWWSGAWELLSDRGRIRQLVESFGLFALVAYVLLLAAQAILAPLPTPAIAAAGGYAFGTFAGFLLTWLGVLLGGALLSSRYGSGTGVVPEAASDRS